MFHTLETTWDQSARRRWTTLASFTMQALGLSLLLLIPTVSVQKPPELWTRFAEGPFLAPPEASPQPSPPGAGHASRASELNGIHVVAPPSIPPEIARVNDIGVPAAPDVSRIGVRNSTGERRTGFFGPSEESVAIVPLPPPVSAHPLRISHWAEGNIIHRVQPVYPILAHQARIQGSVRLRAIISRAGTIENLTVLSGHAMLIKAALEAVEQWRYRPYLLNGEPIEVETDITVNFVLAGS